jgi:formylglycine-generating enzyme required for sulfatase activity
MGKTEVTQNQWRQVMGNHEFWFSGEGMPAEEVSWYDCQRFVQTLARREGVPVGFYRLPVEEEWEYACRAGTTTAYYFGDDPEPLHEFAEYRLNNNSSPLPVPRKRPNAWGLYNTLGNLMEWCHNKFRMYETGEPLDADHEVYRCVRGGHWRSPADECRAAERGLLPPMSLGNLMGFRVMREAVDFRPGPNPGPPDQPEGTEPDEPRERSATP